MDYKLYFVGGAVRDQFLGLKPKDIDYSVEIENYSGDIRCAFADFQVQIESEGFEVFLSTPNCFTIRAKFPKGHQFKGAADFVLCRKEIFYIPNTRTPISELGTIYDDMLRRDYRVNAIAKNDKGGIYDPFNGIEDLNNMILDTPTDPKKSFHDDPLRIIRGMRFCITKGFTFSDRVKTAITEIGLQGMEVVSEERIREEMHKCFYHDTHKTLKYLNFIEIVDVKIKNYEK